jgi:hypothetical protein
MLKFPHVKWPELAREEPNRLNLVDSQAYYECERCRKKIRDKHKQAMLEAGEWRSASGVAPV